MRIRSLILLILFLTARSAIGQLETSQIQVADRSMSYDLYTPTDYEGEELPLVLSLHGFDSDTSTHRLITNMNSIADQHRAFVAYPSARGKDWFPSRDGYLPGSNIDFLKAVVDDVARAKNVDQERIGVAGMSQGATIGLALVAEYPSVFSSIVTVAGTRFHLDDVLIPEDVPAVPTSPMSRLHIHGTADSIAPVDGGSIAGSPMISQPVVESISSWAATLSCDPDPSTGQLEDSAQDGLTSELVSYTCPSFRDVEGNETPLDVQFVRVNGGGHNWPGDFTGWPANFQPVTRDFSASTLAVQFIAEHPREYLLGDFSRDWQIDGTDIDILTANQGGDLFFDLNDDEAVDSRDRTYWVSTVAQSFYGDANLDGVVDFNDFQTLAANFGAQGGWAEGNFDGIGGVAFPDFLLLADHFGSFTTRIPAPVPEQTSFFLMAWLAPLFALIRRKYKLCQPSDCLLLSFSKRRVSSHGEPLHAE